jgi:hypothetical protein
MERENGPLCRFRLLPSHGRRHVRDEPARVSKTRRAPLVVGTMNLERGWEEVSLTCGLARRRTRAFNTSSQVEGYCNVSSLSLLSDLS